MGAQGSKPTKNIVGDKRALEKAFGALNMNASQVLIEHCSKINFNVVSGGLRWYGAVSVTVTKAACGLQRKITQKFWAATLVQAESPQKKDAQPAKRKKFHESDPEDDTQVEDSQAKRKRKACVGSRAIEVPSAF